MAVNPAERQAVLDHLTAADFELRVASGFACLQRTPAHDNLRSAVQQAQSALAWVKRMQVTQEPMKKKIPSIGQGLPLTRKERVSYRWL